MNNLSKIQKAEKDIFSISHVIEQNG